MPKFPHPTLALAALLSTAVPARADVHDAVDWPAFLGRQDEVWNRLPDRWGNGVLLGDGLLGANVFTTDGGTALQWRVGRTDVAFHGNRLPIGELVLHPVGRITGGTLRLSLWDAELTGVVHTTAGDIRLRSFTHADRPVQVIRLQSDPGEAACRWEWRPGLAVNPRLVFQKKPPPDAERNPPPVVSDAGDVHLCAQPLLDGNGYATAWTDRPTPDGRELLLTVGFGKAADATVEATAAVHRAATVAPAELARSHQAWWHRYWPRSFVSVPDDRLQAFYDIQMYKLASATRADRPAIDLQGPWTAPTPWPKIWWNLNLQLTYWPLYTANRLELAQSLRKLLADHAAALAANAGPLSVDSAFVGRATGYDCVTTPPDGPEVCNLPWACHDLWLQYRRSMDESLLRDTLFPLLRRSINFYLHHLKPDATGTLHLDVGYSPEYPNQPTPNPDCNIDLALLRWGCQTLIDANDRLKLSDPLRPTWVDTLKRLVPYPTDGTGLRISASMPLAVSHRHFSHLLMVYPLYLMTPDDPGQRTLIERSLAHWMGMPAALQGYSYTGASSISSLLGRGDDALMYLDRLLDKRVLPNTLYQESGPVIETPLAAAASVNDMLLSGWGGRLHVFPAVPAAWPDVTVANLAGDGGFRVSAVRVAGRTRWVQVTSLAGEPCVIQTDAPRLHATGATCRETSPGRYAIALPEGGTATLFADTPDATIAPVVPLRPREHAWGLP